MGVRILGLTATQVTVEPRGLGLALCLVFNCLALAHLHSAVLKSCVPRWDFLGHTRVFGVAGFGATKVHLSSPPPEI